jgi:hypothetical protein
MGDSDLHLVLPPGEPPHPLTVSCYYCQAQPRQACRTAAGAATTPHALRLADAELAARGLPVNPPHTADVIELDRRSRTRKRTVLINTVGHQNAVLLDFVAARQLKVARKNGFLF